MLPAIHQQIQAYRSGLDEILQNLAHFDWESLVEAEIDWADSVNRVWAVISHLSNVADSEELRPVYREALQEMTHFETERGQNQALFKAYRQLRQGSEFDQLTTSQQRVIDNELRDFHLAGVSLKSKDRARFAEIEDKLSQLSNQFDQNLLDATNAWHLSIDDEQALQGLPEPEKQLLQQLAAEADETGWRIDLSYPSYAAIQTYADDRSLRQRLHNAYVSRASTVGEHATDLDNLPVIRELLALRRQQAQLLDFSDYAEYALQTRMAESTQSVMEFLQQLAEQAKPLAQQQFQALQQFALSQGGPESLQPWDLAYWSEKLRQAEHRITDAETRPYFPLPAVLEGLFQVVSRLFQIKFSPDESVPVWQRDVVFYWLLDGQGNKLGGLYTDVYIRPEKRGGAWMDVCRSRCLRPAGRQLPIAYLNCNFPLPTAERPALLSHREVETLFHEMGHCLHHLLTRVDWPQVNGISGVEWDAVELPSQLLECWCWEKSALGRFARHYQTGELLPDELFDRLLAAKGFQKAMQLLRQLEFALMDMALHCDADGSAAENPQQITDAVRAQVCVVPVAKRNRFLNSFSHIFSGGYAAGYYSYLWAEQLSQDAYQRFRDEGIFSAEAGAALRREILEVGGARPALESFQAFRKRPPSIDPLLHSYGIGEG